ncbi:putative DNA-binding protein [Carnobacterium sp.]|uniref:putative DNA-binding protein n=1 Tax=Carnobacterium sp. TaxID=48221 RepID=UPI00388D1080
MEIEKTNQMNALFDFYGSLLTDKQKSYMQLYYADDFSLGEIAEEFEVSRQAIYDNIRRTENSLIEYEKKLHLLEDFNTTKAVIEDMSSYIKSHYPKDEVLKQFIELLKKDRDEK